MHEVRNQLRQAQTILIAFIVAGSGLSLMVLSRRVVDLPSALSWLAFFPLTEIGGLLFSSGLLGIGIDYLLRRNSEALESARLARVLTDHAPALRDAVIDGFAFQPAEMARVATPDTLDRIIRNSLGIRLNDEDFADQIYTGLLAETVRSSERWHDTTVSLRLSRPALDGAAESDLDDAAFVLTARWAYSVVPTTLTRRFTCVSDDAEYRDLADDPSTSVWFFKPMGGLTAAARDSFELMDFTVDGTRQRIRRSARNDSQTYTVSLGPDVLEAKKLVAVAYTYKTLIRRAGNVLNLGLEQSSRGLSIELDYTDCGIDRMRLLDYVPLASRPRVSYTPSTVPQRAVRLESDGWVLPGSGAAFIWSTAETSQHGPRRR